MQREKEREKCYCGRLNEVSFFYICTQKEERDRKERA
jgi:hypothetical protein